MAMVVLLGTLDTKGDEYAYLRMTIQAEGYDVVLVDVCILGEPRTPPDISRDDVARSTGATIAELVATGDRGAAIETMARDATATVQRLHAEGRLDGMLGLGGSGGSSLITHAMRALPIGVPKLIVSTMASGDTRPYVGVSDVTMMYLCRGYRRPQPHFRAHPHQCRRRYCRNGPCFRALPALRPNRTSCRRDDVRRDHTCCDRRS